MNSSGMRVECAHGDGNQEGSRATRRDVDTAGFAGEGREPPILPAFEPAAGGEPVRRICGGTRPAILCGQARAAELGARDGLAGARLTGVAALSAGGAGGIAAGSLYDFADAAVD